MGEENAMSKKRVELEVENFNLKYPVGTEGNLRRDNGLHVATRIRGEAYEMCGQSVAFFDGISGAYKTDRFTAAD